MRRLGIPCVRLGEDGIDVVSSSAGTYAQSYDSKQGSVHRAVEVIAGQSCGGLGGNLPLGWPQMEQMLARVILREPVLTIVMSDDGNASFGALPAIEGQQ